MDIRTEKMEETLFKALEAADMVMEKRYGDKFALHPARPPHGTSVNRQYDGLFEFNAGFSAGFGSKFGPGYALGFRIVTLETVPKDFRAKFEEEAIQVLQEELTKAFPERELRIVRDNDSWKIIGDLTIC